MALQLPSVYHFEKHENVSINVLGSLLGQNLLHMYYNLV